MQKISDAIRTVTAKVQQAIDGGYRSRAIDADDLVEVLLAIADELDPEVSQADEARSLVSPIDACPACGERDTDLLIWDADVDYVHCFACGTIYDPQIEVA